MIIYYWLMKCNRHELKRDYLFCLDDGCKSRLGCIECQVVDEQHKGHRYIVIKELGEIERDGGSMIANTEIVELMNGLDIKIEK